MIDRRTLMGGAVAAVAGIGLTGCSRGDRRASKGADAVPVSWVKYRIGFPASIDPLHVADRHGLQVLKLLFCPLMRLQGGEVVPAAARGVDVSDDARTFTFHLVDGATFHDGEAVTASSFKRAWERLVRAFPQDGEGGDADAAAVVDGDDAVTRHSRWGSLLSLVEGYDALREGRASELVGLRCPDDLTLAVSLAEPYAAFPMIASHPAMGPVPTSALDDPAAYDVSPVGNGPFKLKRAWEGKGDIHLLRFDECVVTTALADGALLVVNDDTAASYNQFQAGNIDICDVPVDRLEDAEESAGLSADGCGMGPGGRLAYGAEAGLTYLVCNTRTAPFDRVEFRRAVSCAIDRESLCRKVLNGSAAPAQGPIASHLGDVAPWEACGYDAERALELVQGLIAESDEREAGLESGSAPVEEGDPVVPFEASFTLLYRDGGVMGRVAAQIASDLKEAEVRVKTEALDPEELIARLDSTDFACGLMTFEPAVPAVAPIADALFGPSSPQAAWAGVEDVELSTALSDARGLVDPVSRLARTGEAIAFAGEDIALIPLVHPRYAKIASDRVEKAQVGLDGTVDIEAVVLS